MVRCSTPNQTREEDSIEEIEAELDEADMVSQPESTNFLFCSSPLATAENSATMKRSDERVGFNQPTTHELCYESQL